MIISKTPLRMSFFGGGSDLASYFENSKFGYGSVISTTINKYIYIVVNKRYDDKIRVVYNGNELVDSVDEVKHNIIRNALKVVGIDKGIEIIYFSDISISSAGVGLSSSSALTVGVLNALYKYKGIEVDAKTLCKQAYHIERDLIGQACGIQDQAACAYGGLRKYRFFKNGDIEDIKVECKEEYLNNLKSNLMMFYVGTDNGNRDSGKILKEQDQNNSSKMDKLDALVEAVDRNYQYLINGDIDKWGEELDAAWKIKRGLASGVSTGLIDDVYTRSKEAGAIGGKILGAGGGGFVLLYVPKAKQDAVREALKDIEEFEFGFEEKGSSIVYID